MRSKEAQEIAYQGVRAGADRARGIPRSLFTFSSGHAAELHLANAMRLPVQMNPDNLQSGTDFVFMAGYSVIGGGDVLG